MYYNSKAKRLSNITFFLCAILILSSISVGFNVYGLTDDKTILEESADADTEEIPSTGAITEDINNEEEISNEDLEQETEEANAKEQEIAEENSKDKSSKKSALANEIRISDANQLVDLLNQRTVAAGDVYVLDDDFTIDSQDLTETYFPVGMGGNGSNFLSSFDGNNKTITVNVTNGEKTRPLFNKINNNGTESVYIKDLNIKYTGDVKMAPLALSLNYCNVENVNIAVDGNIVAWNYSLRSGQIYLFASGFVVQEENCEIRNNSIKANLIGRTDDSPVEGTGMTANGFVSFSFYSVIENNSVNAEKIYSEATENSGCVAAGFSSAIGFADKVEGNTIDIGDIISNCNAGYDSSTGSYGFSVTTNEMINNDINITGDIYSVVKNRHQSGYPATTISLGLTCGSRQDEPTTIKSNTLTVGGDIRAEGKASTYSTGGFFRGNESRFNILTSSNNNIHVKGDIVAETSADSVGTSNSARVFGLGYLINNNSGDSSTNDKVVIDGNLRADNKNGAAYAIGFASGAEGCNDIEKGKLEVQSDIHAISSTNAYASGFTVGSNTGEKVKQQENQTVVSNIFANGETGSFASGYFPTTMYNTDVENVSIKVKESIRAYGPGTLYASGFSYNISGTSSVKNSIIEVEDQVEVEHTQSSSSRAAASGFSFFNQGNIETNAVFVKNGVQENADTSGDAFKTSFVGGVRDNGSLKNNVIFGFPIDQANLKELYEIFTLENPTGSTTYENNGIVLALGEQRINVGIEFDNDQGKCILSDTDNIGKRMFVSGQGGTVNIKKEFKDDISIVSPDSSQFDNSKTDDYNAVITKSNNDSQAMLIMTDEGGVTTIKDLIGNYDSNENKISGTLFIDENEDGTFNGTDSYFSNKDVKLYFQDKLVETTITDTNGEYEFIIPLLSGTYPDYQLEIDIPPLYKMSTNTNNDFNDQGKVDINSVNYGQSYNKNGILNKIDGIEIVRVFYDLKGGTLDNNTSVPTSNLTSGSAVKNPGIPQKKYKEFDGWIAYYTTGNQVIADEQSGDRWNFDKDKLGGQNIKLVAQWKDILCEVKFDLNGAKDDTIKKQSVTAGDKVRPVANPERKGYIFDGWYKKKYSVGKQSKSEQWDISKDIVEQDIVLYAGWKVKEDVSVGAPDDGNNSSSDNKQNGSNSNNDSSKNKTSNTSNTRGAATSDQMQLAYILIIILLAAGGLVAVIRKRIG